MPYEQNVQSSAIWRITFDYTGDLLYVVYSSNKTKQYAYKCYADAQNALKQCSSFGKCIAQLRHEKAIIPHLLNQQSHA
jgi:hypothetical protein